MTEILGVNALVLDDGMPVTCRGHVVRQGSGLAVVDFCMGLELSDSGMPLEAPSVKLTVKHEAVGQECEQLLSQAVVASGTWLHGRLHVRAVRRVECVDCEHGPAPLANTLDFTPVTPAIQAVEAPLFESGAMLWRYQRTTQEGHVEVIVSATDVDLVLRTLEPQYGVALRVYQSPWTSSQLEELDRVLDGIDPSRVENVGAGVSDVGVVSRSLLVTFVDQKLADSLNPFPTGMLVVDAVARPDPSQ